MGVAKSHAECIVTATGDQSLVGEAGVEIEVHEIPILRSEGKAGEASETFGGFFNFDGGREGFCSALGLAGGRGHLNDPLAVEHLVEDEVEPVVAAVRALRKRIGQLAGLNPDA